MPPDSDRSAGAPLRMSPGGHASRNLRAVAVHWPNMPCVAPELLTLLIAERLAFERLQRLRGYPDDVVTAAEDQLQKATDAVRQYRATHQCPI